MNIFFLVEIKPCCVDEGDANAHPLCISCKVSFKSNKPVSFTENIFIKDTEGNR